jgi:transcriptional regulator with XRE-family HTH domain
MKKIQKKKLFPLHKTRLEQISNMLKEMRFSEGKNQSDFSEYGLSRRQIQRGEYGCNISLVRLFTLLDCYGYQLDEFFEGMK